MPNGALETPIFADLYADAERNKHVENNKCDMEKDGIKPTSGIDPKNKRILSPYIDLFLKGIGANCLPDDRNKFYSMLKENNIPEF